MTTLHANITVVDRERVKNWFRGLLLYFNVKIDLSRFIIKLIDGG